MGRLIHHQDGSGLGVDDRTLAHLQLVMGSKLRRGEAFLFSWSSDVSTGSGRQSVWIHPRGSLTFRYSGGEVPRLNPAWIDLLVRAANTPAGPALIPEPEPSEPG